MLVDDLLIEGFSLPLFNRQRSLRAVTKACPQPVAVDLAYQSSLAIYDLKCSFCAGHNTLPASGALGFVDTDDLPECQGNSFFWLG